VTDQERVPELLSRHGRALLALAERPDLRQRDLATRLGVTERTVGGIIADLERAGYLQRRRIGRRNHYDVTIPEQFTAASPGPAARGQDRAATTPEAPGA